MDSVILEEPASGFDGTFVRVVGYTSEESHCFTCGPPNFQSSLFDDSLRTVLSTSTKSPGGNLSSPGSAMGHSLRAPAPSPNQNCQVRSGLSNFQSSLFEDSPHTDLSTSTESLGSTLPAPARQHGILLWHQHRTQTFQIDVYRQPRTGTTTYVWLTSTSASPGTRRVSFAHS